jgi:hypothetical protein
MNTATHDLPRKWLPALEDLACRPATLVCAALLLSALAQPYAGFAHDARLYAAQVTERIDPGTFADDLYLRYGSQDRFSAFTLLLSPVVAALGLGAGFFAVYLASKALFFWGALRLLQVLLRDPTAVTLSLVLLALSPGPIGGNEIFHVNEAFLTPRIASCALVFFALERLLAGAPKPALLCLAGSFVLHPLMALGGILTALLWWLACRLTWRRLLFLLAAATGGACLLLAYPPLAQRLLGAMEPEWRDVTLEVCFFIQPAEWAWSDWARLGWGALVVGAAAFGFAWHARGFLGAVLVTAAVGLLGTCVAVHSPYLLLIQTSPYRTLWLLEFLAPPLTLLGGVRLLRDGTGSARAAALALLVVAVTGWHYNHSRTLVFLGLGVILAAVPLRGLGLRPMRPDWLWRSASLAFLVGLGLLAVYNLVVLVALFAARPTFEVDLHPVQVLLAAPRALYRLPLFAVAVFAVHWLAARRSEVRACLPLLGLWVGYQAAILSAQGSAWYGRTFTASYGHVDFVRSYLAEQRTSAGVRPTVYWPTDLRTIWFEARSASYFNWVQMSGCAFNRGTAVEGKRRSRLVRPFEAENARRWPSAEPWWQEATRRFYQFEGEGPSAGARDLLALCDDPVLDFVVLDQGFEGLYSATDGRLYVYDCRRLRALARGQETIPLTDVKTP